MIVPGVTRRTTSRRTTDFAPALPGLGRVLDLLADGDPVAGARSAAAGSRRRASTGTPHIGMSAPWCLPRLVSTMPSAAAGDLGVLEEQLVEIAHPVEQQAIRVGAP